MSLGLNYDLGDKSENLRRMNHFEKFNKLILKELIHETKTVESIILISLLVITFAVSITFFADFFKNQNVVFAIKKTSYKLQ